MLKLIRILPGRDLYTLKGFGVPEGKIPVGSFVDATEFLAQLGVPQAEINLAEAFLKDRPDHNAVEFGIGLGTVCTLSVDTKEFLIAMGIGPDVAAIMEGEVRPCA